MLRGNPKPFIMQMTQSIDRYNAGLIDQREFYYETLKIFIEMFGQVIRINY